MKTKQQIQFWIRQKLLLIVAMSFGLVLSAQNNLVTVYGKVVDTKNNPLEAVSINVNQSNIATVTNTEGEFVLKVPERLESGIITISLLGYKSRMIQLSVLRDDAKDIILQEDATQLSAVNIEAYKSAESLVRKVFSRLGGNTNKAAYMTAFYRETIKRRNRNVSLTEAVVNILKQPHVVGRRDAVKLNKARKITDYKRLDTISIKLQGGPFSTLHLDVMKYPDFIFTDEAFDYYAFTFSQPTVINDRNVYVVNFEPKKEGLNMTYFGKLFIDVQSIALVSAEYSLDLSNKARSRNLLVRKRPNDVIVYPMEANYKVDYKQQGKQWYYSYSNLYLKFKVNKKRQLFNKVYTLSSEMAVTDWEINTEDKTIARKERLRPSVIITDAISGFSDPDFWGEYNLIEPDKSIERAIEKIKKNLEKS